jgi:hypothetical protein
MSARREGGETADLLEHATFEGTHPPAAAATLRRRAVGEVEWIQQLEEVNKCRSGRRSQMSAGMALP